MIYWLHLNVTVQINASADETGLVTASPCSVQMDMCADEGGLGGVQSSNLVWKLVHTLPVNFLL